MKLSNYVQFGRGRGLRLVCLGALLLSLIYSGFIYYVGSQYIKLPFIQDFLKAVPTFTVKDGVVQDKTIRWRSQLPLSPLMLTIDTTQEELVPPVADGVYVTSKYVYNVAYYGAEVRRSDFPKKDFELNYESLNLWLQMNVTYFSIGIAVTFFIFSLAFFLALVAIAALLGFCVRARLGEGRVWRSSAIAWCLGQILNIAGMVFAFVGASWAIIGKTGGFIILAVCILVDLLLLIKNKN